MPEIKLSWTAMWWNNSFHLDGRNKETKMELLFWRFSN